jgi:uncharacterized protein YndB with AHSA1/START domain
MATTGRYEEADGRPLIRFERTFEQPRRTVWAAITDPDQLGLWFPTSVEFEALRTGEQIRFRFAEDRYPPMAGEIREVRERERFAFTWGDDFLIFELEDGSGGEACRLAFTVHLDAAAKAARDGAGWETCLDALGLLVAGERPRRPMSSDRWQAYYDEYRDQGAPATAPIPE